MGIENLARALEEDWDRNREPGMPTLRELIAERLGLSEEEDEEEEDELEYVRVVVEVDGFRRYIPAYEAIMLAAKSSQLCYERTKKERWSEEEAKKFLFRDLSRRLQNYARKRYQYL